MKKTYQNIEDEEIQVRQEKNLRFQSDEGEPTIRWGNGKNAVYLPISQTMRYILLCRNSDIN
jgi:hypothetical protein